MIPTRPITRGERWGSVVLRAGEGARFESMTVGLFAAFSASGSLAGERLFAAVVAQLHLVHVPADQRAQHHRLLAVAALL